MTYKMFKYQQKHLNITYQEGKQYLHDQHWNKIMSAPLDTIVFKYNIINSKKINN